MENIIKVPIVEELESSMLDYGMSVITDRALPSAEDGLKPVNRRILYDMFDKGYFNNKKFVKCAQPVGDTMGRFHPHGDSSIYGALAAMSQPWNMRYPLISWHGNNGSRDGDEPAAYRYTECKLSPIGEYMLEDIRKDTVDWQNAYTDEELEPIYLTGGIPNLEVNGTYGIAWSTACSFAPHNMNEIMDAAIHILNNPDCEVKDILKFIKGPDFPTAGKIINEKDLPSIYLTGRGKAVIRGEYEIEKSKKSDLIVFSSIPFKISKEKLLKDIDDLCEKGTLIGIKSMRDETNHQGVRFVIEVESGMATQIVEKLFALTDLESSFSVNQVVLVDKKPKLLNTKELLNVYIDHQKDVLIRKSKFESKEISARIHILEGLLIALASIDEVIELIRKSASSIIAKDNLIKKYSLSEIQAKAILDMKLSKLAKLESIEIQKEKEEKAQRLNELSEIIINPVPELNKIFINIKNKFGDERRTSIAQIDVQKEKKTKEKAEIEPEKVVVILTEDGSIKRIPATTFKVQSRNTKGIKTQSDIVKATIRTNTVDSLLVFSNFGKVYRIPVNDIPVGTNTSQGQLITTLVQMGINEKPCLIYSVYKDTEKKYIVFITENGLVKKTTLEEYNNIKKKGGSNALKLREGDALAAVSLMNEEDLIVLTSGGMGIRFNINDISPSGKTSIGVKGINLKPGDKVVAALPVRDETDGVGVFSLSGLGKRIKTSDFSRQARGGKGVIVYKPTATSGEVVAGAMINDEDSVLLTGNPNSLCISGKDIPILSRQSVGNQLIKGGIISSVSKI